MKNIVIATGNAGKVKEFKEMFAGLGVSVTSLADHVSPIPDIAETGATFYENAKIKADWVYQYMQQTRGADGGGVWTLADDSGLEVDALGGAPGVLSARYSGEGANSVKNNEKLLNALSDVPDEKRTARFKCVLVLKTGINTYLSAEGVCEGRIINEIIGSNGFGYDPLFVPKGYDRTMAQLTPEEKNCISHRGAALRGLYAVMDDGGTGIVSN
ncbi:MAG: RdgB/HAM1 family non-canonical purine NTP pyrophosphatase [Chitinispirillales bacterium]|jgi:XTP/dITP diphosphohydrolase|nr:RdgB/HAM1 family non-canonical purine NTP pyrophosphatase [Chitinispirillales bacterium]